MPVLCGYLARAKWDKAGSRAGGDGAPYGAGRCDLEKPDGCQFIQGDSDEVDLRDKITMGAWLFRDPVLKYAGFDRMDFEGAWDFGRKASLEYRSLPAEKPGLHRHA